MVLFCFGRNGTWVYFESCIIYSAAVLYDLRRAPSDVYSLKILVFSQGRHSEKTQISSQTVPQMLNTLVYALLMITNRPYVIILSLVTKPALRQILVVSPTVCIRLHFQGPASTTEI